MAVAGGCDETLFAQFIFGSQVKEWQESQRALSGRVRDSVFRSSGHKLALPNRRPQYAGSRPRVHPLSMQSGTASVSQKRASVAGFHLDSSVFALRWRRKKKRPKFDRWSRKKREIPKINSCSVADCCKFPFTKGFLCITANRTTDP